MIIDDEPDIREYLMAALEDNEYVPCTVMDNETVLNAVNREKPDLIILDIMMPRQSGISVYKDLRASEIARDIPVALISGLATSKEMMTTDLIDAIDAGQIPTPDGFIEKPVRLVNFLNMVKELLDQGA
jgi:two-component system, OmpR family, phosphate regulon response regulator PhoB